MTLNIVNLIFHGLDHYNVLMWNRYVGWSLLHPLEEGQADQPAINNINRKYNQ